MCFVIHDCHSIYVIKFNNICISHCTRGEIHEELQVPFETGVALGGRLKIFFIPNYSGLVLADDGLAIFVLGEHVDGRGAGVLETLLELFCVLTTYRDMTTMPILLVFM